MSPKLIQTLTPEQENISTTKHLDLGCGKNPRNPYNQSILYGIDIASFNEDQNFKFFNCNVILTDLPFEDSKFDSVSAYDFLEHIPREIVINGVTQFPFIHVMNEIFRVLKPNGKFYALTPAYPKESVFVDPTHVNFITKNTHKYFTQPHNWAIMYGYTGNFSIIRAKWCYFRNETKVMGSFETILKSAICIIYPRMMQHFVWEFKAIK